MSLAIFATYSNYINDRCVRHSAQYPVANLTSYISTKFYRDCLKLLQKTKWYIFYSDTMYFVAFLDMNIDDFWKWTDFSSYIQFMVVFTLLAGVVTFMFIRSPYYVELLGLLALMTEAMLGVPQFYRNYRNKSTEGMR